MPEEINLERAFHLVQSLQASIRAAPFSHFTYTAPVIDKDESRWVSEYARGINKFSEQVDLISHRIETMIQQGVIPREDPLPSVEAAMTVWKTALSARAPVTSVRVKQRSPTQRGGGKQTSSVGKREEGPVDVICRGGAEWIKIYSKKVSGLIAEFREQDSMINSDWDDSDDDNAEGSCGHSTSGQRGSSSKPGLTNSLVDMADMLLDLIQLTDRPPGAADPLITIRVTRIPQDCDLDPRFQETFTHIRQKGINLVFGDLSEIDISSLPRALPDRKLKPSRKICLDPTALMGLCSDLLHHPLPYTKEGAIKRFFRPKEALENRPGGSKANGPGRGGVGEAEEEEESWKGQSQNSRELVKNLLEEMESPLIEEIRDLLKSVEEEEGGVEWWSTREAVRYLQEALGSEEVVGEGMEQRRMKRMIGLEEGDFFEGSRYEGVGAFKDFKLRIFDEDDEDGNDGQGNDNGNARSGEANGKNARGNGTVTKPAVPTTFHRALSDAAQSCIDDYNAYRETILNDKTTNKTKIQNHQQDLPNFLKPQRIPIPKVAQLSVPFPIVSLITLARGCKEGMTVMMFGNVVLRDLFGQPRWRPPGWVQGNYEVELDGFESNVAVEGKSEKEVVEVDAAVWMLPYRSLGEGKRVKFENGDYSYPNHG